MNWKSNGLYTNKLKNSNKTKKKLGKKMWKKVGSELCAMISVYALTVHCTTIAATARNASHVI